jgi:hypothetical protein
MNSYDSVCNTSRLAETRRNYWQQWWYYQKETVKFTIKHVAPSLVPSPPAQDSWPLRVEECLLSHSAFRSFPLYVCIVCIRLKYIDFVKVLRNELFAKMLPPLESTPSHPLACAWWLCLPIETVKRPYSTTFGVLLQWPMNEILTWPNLDIEGQHEAAVGCGTAFEHSSFERWESPSDDMIYCDISQFRSSLE